MLENDSFNSPVIRMALLGTLIKNGIKLREVLEQKYDNPLELQKHELLKLIIQARQTEFGIYHNFDEILNQFGNNESNHFSEIYKRQVPIHDYDLIFYNWWHKCRKGKKNVCWPGKVNYFALSSGTSGDSSKYIPVTKDMLKSMRRVAMRQFLSLSQYNVPDNTFAKGTLMLGGSTSLKKVLSYYEGDLSGITTSKVPIWLKHTYKPGKKISKCTNWGDKLESIVDKAPEWDIGFIVGVPAWIQMLLEKIIDKYGLEHIHDIWPNLNVYVHGGVSFTPYESSFKRLLGKDISYIETYLASEGFIAYQSRPNTKNMKLVLNNGIFFEFVPFNEENFNRMGQIKPSSKTLLIDEVKEGEEYAILITTCSGAWRYLIGDVIKFTSVEKSEIIITGRTTHFLSLCGEHLSIDNMNKAIRMIEEELGIGIKEFTVTGYPSGNYFTHKWFLGCNDDVSEDLIRIKLDEKLKELNDDYRVERDYALKYFKLEKLPVNIFYKWMKSKGKEGAQIKFPRVLNAQNYMDWENFLQKEIKKVNI